MNPLTLAFEAVRAFFRGVLLGCKIAFPREESRAEASMLARTESNGPARDDNSISCVRADPESFFTQVSAANRTPAADRAAAESPAGPELRAHSPAGRSGLTRSEIRSAAYVIAEYGAGRATDFGRDYWAGIAAKLNSASHATT